MLVGVPVVIWFDSSRTASSRSRHVALVGHTRPVLGVAFSPGARWLASYGNDRTVRLWDAWRWNDGDTAESSPLPHPSDVLALAFSPDGKLLATAAVGSLAFWSGGPPSTREAEWPGQTYHALAFSPDGRTLALGGEDDTIRLWEMPAARERAVLRGAGDTVYCVAFSPDGKRLASGSHDGRAMLWDPEHGTRLRVLLDGGPTPVRAVAFSPDGRTLGVADPSGSRDALLFDVESAAIRARLPGGRVGIVSVAFSPDRRLVATAGIDHPVSLWDPASTDRLATIPDGGTVRMVAVSPDGRWLACAGGDGDVRLVDLSPITAELDAKGQSRGIDPVSGSRDDPPFRVGRS